MAEFDVYIPMDRRQALYKGERLPERTTGAALFADISGFTPLTGALVAELGSKRGAEEVLRHINSIYEALIAELHRYGGSVIGFVGDAITCWLDDAPLFDVQEEAPLGSQRAVACGLAMQEAMQQFATIETAAGTTISLAVKVAVAAGPVSRLLVGDPEVRVIETLAGAMLQRMAKAEKQAKKGEVVVSQEVVQQLADLVTVQEWRADKGFAVIGQPPGQGCPLGQGIAPTPPGQPQGIAPTTPGQPQGIAPTWPVIPPDAFTEAMTRPWLMQPIYERLRLGSTFLGELRPVVPIFLRFRTLDYDQDEAAGSQLDAYIRWVQSIVGRYEGILVDLTIGDKGSFLYAAFGAPIAHHDDAERAVAAALELRTLPEELSVFGPVEIGISRGDVWTGACGAKQRKKYVVMGNQVNMSIRLMSKAKPGQILLHDRVVQAVGNRAYQFNSLGEIMVKGRATPLPVSEVVGVREQRAAREQAPPSHALVGRKSEMAQLEAALDAVQTGGSAVIIAEGAPGIGKSRLVAELVGLAEAQGLSVLLGAGQSIERHTPYRAWRDVFSAYFGLDTSLPPPPAPPPILGEGSSPPLVLGEGLGVGAGKHARGGGRDFCGTTDTAFDAQQSQQRVRRVVEEVAPEQIERLPLLNDVLNLGFPDTELTASLEPAFRQESLLVFLLTLLRAAPRPLPPRAGMPAGADLLGEQPLILVLEDAHWLDSLSWEVAVQVARGLMASSDPFLLVLVTRPLRQAVPELVEGQGTALDEQSIGAAHLASLQALPATTLSLDTLNHEEIVALVSARLGVQRLPEAVAELVRTRAEGNPFFAEELLLTLRDEGLIGLQETGELLISDDFAQASLTLPDTLQGLILARIDRLSPQKKLTLKVAAVIGRTFGYTPLHYTLNQHIMIVEQLLQEQLDDLNGRDLTKVDTPEPDLTYIFKHIITQEVTYQTLLFAQRRQLHRTVAQWYETTFGAPRLSQEGQPASRGIAPTDPLAPYYPLLVHHYHHAEDNERERHYAKLAGEQAAAQYANQEAVRYFSRALDLTPEDDVESRYELLLAREKVYDRQGKREAQTEDLLALATLALTLNDEVKKATVSLRQAHYARRTGGYPAALLAVQQAIANVAHLQEAAVQAEAYYIWGLTLRRQAIYKEAQQRLEQALTLARASQQAKIEADSLQQLGNVNYQLGNLSVAPSYYQQALPIYRTALDRKGEADCLVMLGLVHTDIGEYLAGQEHFRQALTIYQTIGYRLGETIVLGNLGNNYCYLGEYQVARDYQQKALLISREIGDREGESFAFCNLALLHYHLGDHERARNDCQQALALHHEIGDRHNEGYTLTYLGHTLTESGELQLATEAYQKAIQVRRELAQEKLVMDDLAGLASVAMREANNSQALRYVEEIQAWIERHGTEGIEYPLQVYLTCYQVLQATSEGDSDALARADTILTTAHSMLQEHAAKIKDDALRRKFLQNVPFNREIVETWESKAPL